MARPCKGSLEECTDVSRETNPGRLPALRFPEPPPVSIMRPFLLSIAIPIMVTGLSAHAQGTSPEDLFREGVSLFARGELAAACERFERSYKLDAAPGTLFNLANCHEKQGRLWQARVDYQDLVERATAAGKPDKAKLSQERLIAVEARLPRLAFALPPGNNVASVFIDDSALPDGAWRAPVPVDFGAHVIEFRAPGKVSVKRTLTTPAAALVAVDVPVLAPQATTSPAPLAAPVTAPVSQATVNMPIAQPAEPQGSFDTGRFVAGLVVGGAGLGGAGVGSYLVAHALSLKSDATTACGASPGSNACPTKAQTTQAQTLTSESNTSGIEAGVAFGLGAVALGVGIALVVSGASSHASASGSANAPVLLTPMVGAGVSGLSLTGSF
jgi:hypothetical protein